MFWGKNIKSGETVSLDSDKTILDKILNLTNISLSEALDNTKYYVKIINEGKTFQLCSLDKNNDSVTTSLAFTVKEGMKFSVKGGSKGIISLVGFTENFNEEENELEEINTDKVVETKKEVIPEIKKEKKVEKKK